MYKKLYVQHTHTHTQGKKQRKTMIKNGFPNYENSFER